MMALTTEKKIRKRLRRVFDQTKLTPESPVTMQDIADFTRYSRGYLYNLLSRHRHGEPEVFIEPIKDTTRALRFRWGDVLDWYARHDGHSSPKKG